MVLPKGVAGSLVCLASENRLPCFRLVRSWGQVNATGTGERDGGLDLVDDHLKEGDTLGADKGYDVETFVEELKLRGIRPHIARNTSNGRRSAIEGKSWRVPMRHLLMPFRDRRAQPSARLGMEP